MSGLQMRIIRQMTKMLRILYQFQSIRYTRFRFDANKASVTLYYDLSGRLPFFVANCELHNVDGVLAVDRR